MPKLKTQQEIQDLVNKLTGLEKKYNRQEVAANLLQTGKVKDEAKVELDQTKNQIDSIKNEIKLQEEMVANAEGAQKQVTEAQNNLELATKNNPDNEDLTKSQKGLEEAKSKLESKKLNVASLQRKFDSSYDEVKSKGGNPDEAQDVKQNKESLSTAEKEVGPAEEAVKKAQDDVDKFTSKEMKEAQKALDTASAKLDAAEKGEEYKPEEDEEEQNVWKDALKAAMPEDETGMNVYLRIFMSKEVREFGKELNERFKDALSSDPEKRQKANSEARSFMKDFLQKTAGDGANALAKLPLVSQLARVAGYLKDKLGKNTAESTSNMAPPPPTSSSSPNSAATATSATVEPPKPTQGSNKSKLSISSVPATTKNDIPSKITPK